MPVLRIPRLAWIVSGVLRLAALALWPGLATPPRVEWRQGDRASREEGPGVSCARAADEHAKDRRFNNLPISG